jgi:hypothetical protein
MTTGRNGDHARRRAIAAAMGEPQRSARSTSCRKCGAPVMVGLDNDSCAMTAVVDTYPLSAAGEVVALLSGRVTYSLTWAAKRYEIDYRDSWRIDGHPPGETAGVDIVVNHECGTPTFQRLSTIERGRRYSPPADPPF